MNYDEKLDLIISELAEVKKDIAVLKGSVSTPSAPAQSEGLFRFVRPAVRNVSQWPTDVDMTSADAEEAFQRSLHGVNWRGGHLSDRSYEEAWAEIEALKAGDQKLISEYVYLDPEFAGFALLTGLTEPVKYDAMTFGQAAGHRRAWAGYTIQSFLDAQRAIRGGRGGPSGG